MLVTFCITFFLFSLFLAYLFADLCKQTFNTNDRCYYLFQMYLCCAIAAIMIGVILKHIKEIVNV